jgi:octaprenyl-diphosphate synthase
VHLAHNLSLKSSGRKHAQIYELIGMAFQIKDDLFDYSEDAIGKPTGIDIKQKMTLLLFMF